jgi:hypothetical protein
VVFVVVVGGGGGVFFYCVVVVEVSFKVNHEFNSETCE